MYGNDRIEKAWGDYGGYCAFCGVSIENILLLGLQAVVIIAPPTNEHVQKKHAIPVCSFCAKVQEGAMNRMSKRVRTYYGND